MHEKRRASLAAAGSSSSSQHPSPAPSPERAIYGFALFLASIAAALIYLVWIFVPPEYLEEIGIDFLPNQYWAIVVPLLICCLVFFTPLCYGFICLRLMPENGIEQVSVDEFTRTALYYRVKDTPEGGIPPLCDIPLEHLERELGLSKDQLAIQKSKMRYLPLKLVLGAVSLGLFALGLWDVLANFEPNLCQMTYMFEYPNYVPIEMDESVVKRFPQYGLYVYGEGARTAAYERKVYSGIPVLFIPGNAGSYRQGRSIGSVLLRMSEKRQNSVKFDVFTIDFNEELAALYGGFLSSQTDFVLKCLLHIPSLYGRPHQKVILIGHSVGGLIARGLFLKPGFDTSTVNTIFTLSTPHQPILLVDAEMEEFYADIDDYWSRSANSTLKDVVMVSFAGGHRDVLVRSDRSDLSGLFAGNERFLSMTTTSIPAVWASTDHLCIVWCKQLTLAVAKAIFEMLDGKTKTGLVEDVDRRLETARKYFVNPKPDQNFTADGTTEKPRDLADIRFENSGPLRLNTKKYQPASAHALVVDGSVGDIFIRSNHWRPKWISLCLDASCSGRLPLNISPTRVPWFSENGQFYTLLSDPWKIHPSSSGSSRIVLLFELPKSEDVITLQVEPTPTKESIPSISFWEVLLGVTQRFQPTESSYFRLHVDLQEIWHALHVDVTVSDQCKTNRGMARFTVSGPFRQDTYKLLQHQRLNRFPLKLQAPAKLGDSFPQLELFLNAECAYDVTITVAWLDVLGQVARFYAVQLPAFFAAVVVMHLLPLYCQEGRSLLLDHVLVNVVAGVVLLFNRNFAEVSGDDIFAGSSIPSAVAMWAAFYLTTYSMVSLFETALLAMVALYSFPIHWIARRFVSRLQSMQRRTSTWPARVSIFPLFAVFVTVLSYVTCGENGILLALLLYFAKVCYNKRNSVISLSTTTSEVVENTKILLLAVLVTMLNVIPTLVWTKRLPSGLPGLIRSSYSGLDPDPSFTVSIVVGIVLDFAMRKGTNRRATLTRFSGIFDLLMVLVIYGVAAATLVYAQRVFYLITVFMSVLLMVMSCDFVRRIFTDSQPLVSSDEKTR
ncbi:GPI inositol-deacylase [Hypsibius exemplaris]|uniref:GPI inositol-deacylase n=1 Tax=Hypsibius exemplaris TaxID=2072580 RepID=A0A1W0X218_HYPEX|nr:GPI inositol-deacylase [Hypsibius exemplaris]